MTEVELSRRYKVSRTPIREALQRLLAEHLVSDVQGRGVIVTEPEPDEIFDLYLVREALEGLAARLAAQRGTELDFLSLSAALDAMARVMQDQDRGVAEILDLMVKFDLDLVRVARSDRLVKMCDDLQSFPRRFQRTTLSYPGRAEEILAEHRAIVEALQSRDADAAERAARHHMQKSRDIRIKLTLEGLHGSPTTAAASR
jgi:DNA-binding GntR family transcriptional regulator